MDTSDHGTKSDPEGTFELCLQKIYFINKDRVANNVFDLQNDFHKDRIPSFPVYGEKINLGHF
jgi:hypothetical protein